ncbi:hypothetical protein GCM10010151_73500 [Actinoallomurus spadix]|uniref:Uncharacterized protein n=1 Tax=Actinoallomurus spadix TaxID=79912 RepID=A0ABN0XU14_9ACTN
MEFAEAACGTVRSGTVTGSNPPVTGRFEPVTRGVRTGRRRAGRARDRCRNGSGVVARVVPAEVALQQ